jgi:hypothetical protein
MKKTAYIQDNVFLYAGAKAVGLWGENAGMSPTYFDWVSDIPTNKTVFFTDACVYDAHLFKCARKVAWLCEPPPFRQGHYDYVKWNEHLFDYVLTFDQRLLETGNPKYLFYPMGGSFIHPDRWRKTPKVKLVSLVLSEKTEATGHKLRHLIAKEFGDRIDVIGSGSPTGRYVNKYDALADYAYTICVESEKLNWFFNDKLVDAWAMRTIPLYWGCPEILRFGWARLFETFQELDQLLSHITMDDYFADIDILEHNFSKAKQYYCAEDWIYEQYPFLFD